MDGGRPLVASTLLSLVRQVDGTDSAAVRFTVVSIVRLQKRRCSADVFPVLRNNPSVENPVIESFRGAGVLFQKHPAYSRSQTNHRQQGAAEAA